MMDDPLQSVLIANVKLHFLSVIVFFPLVFQLVSDLFITVWEC